MKSISESILAMSMVSGVLLALAVGSALGAPTVPDSFVGATLESFEGIRLGPNVVTQQGGYMWVKGPIAFSSGVTLSGPFPQPSGDRGLVVCDFSFHPGAAFSLGSAFGTIATPADVPDGAAFIGFSSEDETRPFEFTFSSGMQNVGAFVTGPPDAVATMTAFDSTGGVVASANIQPSHKDFWDENFLSVEASGIKRVTISGRVIVVDALMFVAVPEPASCYMALCGISSCLAYRRRSF